MSGSISVPVRPCAMAENMYGTPAPASARSLCSVFLSVGACSVGANEEGTRGEKRDDARTGRTRARVLRSGRPSTFIYGAAEECRLKAARGVSLYQYQYHGMRRGGCRATARAFLPPQR